jgi:TonB-dependent receptor
MNLPRRYRLTPLALAFLAIPAAAQQAPSAGPAPTRIEVTGYRQSLESALNDKRDDAGIVDVIRAEDIAKFPDTNLAESLQRVPGVVIDRDAGEGRTITIRGLGPDFTRVLINGMEAQASTGGTDSSGGNNRSRGFDFNVFPSDLFSALVVRKSSSADVDEGSLGATVELRTARPFDFTGFKATASIQARYNDLSKDTDPRGAFLISNTFADRTVGVLVSGAFSKRHLFEEGFSTVRWDNGPSSGGWCAPVGVTPANPSNSTATTCGPAAQGVARLPASADATTAFNDASNPSNFHPRLPRYGRLTHDQDRTGLTGSFQWRPVVGTLFTFDYLYSKIKATRQEDFLEAISFSRSAAQGGKPQTSVVQTQYASNGALLYGLYNGVDIRAESRFDELSTTFKQPSLAFEHQINDAWKVSGKVGRSESKFDNPVQTTTTLDALNVNGYAIDFRGSDRLPVITYPFDPTRPNPLTIVGVPIVTSGTQPATIPNTTSSEIRIRPQGSTNRIDAADVEVAWEMMPGNLTWKAGPNYKKYLFDTFEFRRVNQNDTIFPIPGGATIASLTTTLSGFGHGLDLPSGSITSWLIPDLRAIASAYNIYCNCLQSGPVGGPGDFTLSSITNGNARGNNRTVVEKDTGGFLMADFSGTFFGVPARGNIGVRYVKTQQSATGYQATAGGTQVTVDQTYSDTLPAANIAFTIEKDYMVRFAAAKVMARPQLGNLSPGGSITTTGNLSITVGNPLLEPFRAKTFDASFEWYFGKNSFLGLGLFYKDIDTYIQSLRVNVPYSETGLPISLLPPNFTGTEVFQVTTPVNTPGGPLKGYEINYQQAFTFLPDWGRNFGTLLNYTYVKSRIDYLVSPTASATITDDLLNLSPKTWNATLYYDDGRFTARVSGTYRQTFVTRVPGQNNNDVEGKNASTNVDASLSYRVTPNIQLTLEGLNLTNEVNDQFISRARNSAVVYHVTGREYLAGVRVSF